MFDFGSPLFGTQKEIDGKTWVIVQHGVGYNLEAGLAFHIAIPRDVEGFPAQTYLIQEVTDGDKHQEWLKQQEGKNEEEETENE